LVALAATPVLHYLWPIYKYWQFPLNLLGLVPLAVGILLNILADRQFIQHKTTVKPYQESSALVTGFPFSLTRNPMYLGITLMLLGASLLFGSVSSLLPAPIFAVLMDRRFIRMEESMLASSFGAEWESYSKRVRRWL
jgi:protein-S-isoprenylcysteine O-methyltransferase Ste14